MGLQGSPKTDVLWEVPSARQFRNSITGGSNRVPHGTRHQYQPGHQPPTCKPAWKVLGLLPACDKVPSPEFLVHWSNLSWSTSCLFWKSQGQIIIVSLGLRKEEQIGHPEFRAVRIPMNPDTGSILQTARSLLKWSETQRNHWKELGQARSPREGKGIHNDIE